jgi:hypothetical protein
MGTAQLAFAVVFHFMPSFARVVVVVFNATFNNISAILWP